MAKKKKKSVQRIVAEAPSTPKRLRSEAIAGETMKLHPKIQKAKKKAKKATQKGKKASERAFKKGVVPQELRRMWETGDDAASISSYDIRIMNNVRKTLGEAPLTKSQVRKLKSVHKKLSSKSTRDQEKAHAAKMRAEDLSVEAQKLTERRSSSSTVGKAGKEMETRRRKKSKKED